MNNSTTTQIKKAYRKARAAGKLLTRTGRAVHISPNKFNEDTFDCSISEAIEWVENLFSTGDFEYHIGTNGLRQVFIQVGDKL